MIFFTRQVTVSPFRSLYPVQNVDNTHLFLLAAVGGLNRDGDLSALLGGTHHLGTEHELEALFGERALEHLGHLHVDAHAADVAEEFHRRHLRAQSLPHTALKPLVALGREVAH
jgi:hypothetical protein